MYMHVCCGQVQGPGMILIVNVCVCCRNKQISEGAYNFGEKYLQSTRDEKRYYVKKHPDLVSRPAPELRLTHTVFTWTHSLSLSLPPSATAPCCQCVELFASMVEKAHSTEPLQYVLTLLSDLTDDDRNVTLLVKAAQGSVPSITLTQYGT